MRMFLQSLKLKLNFKGDNVVSLMDKEEETTLTLYLIGIEPQQKGAIKPVTK